MHYFQGSREHRAPPGGLINQIDGSMEMEFVIKLIQFLVQHVLNEEQIYNSNV